jgi:hypothetical protein
LRRSTTAALQNILESMHNLRLCRQAAPIALDRHCLKQAEFDRAWFERRSLMEKFLAGRSPSMDDPTSLMTTVTLLNSRALA